MKASEVTAATRLVIMKTSAIAQEIRDSFPALTLEATAEERVKNTSGTITMKMRLRKRSPMGRKVRAVSGKNFPSSSPATMDMIRRSEKPYVLRSFMALLVRT
jgi:hypothetical protein